MSLSDDVMYRFNGIYRELAYTKCVPTRLDDPTWGFEWMAEEGVRRHLEGELEYYKSGLDAEINELVARVGGVTVDAVTK
jgi:hypothetical protein